MAIIRVGEGVVKPPKPRPTNLSRIYPNFIDAYINYTKDQESTNKIRKWVAISLLAGVLERKVWIPFGASQVVPNLYIFIVGESGMVRKSTAIGTGVSLLKQVEHVNIMSEQVTFASLIQQVSRASQSFNHAGTEYRQSALYCKASELVVTVNADEDKLIHLLTDFYDWRSHKDPWSREIKTGNEYTVIYGPCLNMLAGTTPTWLNKVIPVEQAEGGFASRVIYVVEKSPPDKQIFWLDNEQDLSYIKNNLIKDLRAINSLIGPFKATQEAKDYGLEWYVNDLCEKKKACTDSRFKGYYGRKDTYVRKLAMILSVSESNELLLERHHFEQAIGLLDELEKTMFDAFGHVGKYRFAPQMERLKNIVESAECVSRSVLYNHVCTDMSHIEFHTVMTDLQYRKLVNAYSVGGKTFYLWHKTKFNPKKMMHQA